MKQVYFTVGPSQLYPTVGKHVRRALVEQIPSISHRSQQFKEIYANTVNMLRLLLAIPETHQVFFLSSANEAWERILQNCVETSSFHLVNGAFSRKFYEFGLALGKQSSKYEVPNSSGFSIASIEIPEKTELICTTHNETSTGVMTDMRTIVGLKKMHPDILLTVDVVSSVPYVRVDFSVIDIAFFSVQKGFGLPAGLGVLVANQKAIAKSIKMAKKGISVGSYHTFANLEKYGLKNQTSETPNVLAIYLLGLVCQDMLDYGIDRIRQESEYKAALLYDYFGNHRDFKVAVRTPDWRSVTTVAVNTPKGSEMVIKRLKKAGFVVGAGYGELKLSQVRLANFPAHSINQVKRLLSAFAE